MSLNPGCHLGELAGVHLLDLTLGGSLQGQIAVEVFLPARDLLQYGIAGLLLKGIFDLVDFGHHRPHALHYALMFRSDDLLEDPLDHEGRGAIENAVKSGRFHTRRGRQGQGTVRSESVFARGH